MYKFKDTKGKEQSPIEEYFNRDTPDNSLSIGEVAEYIDGVPTGEYAREPIAYAFKQVAMKLGHKEPVLFNQLSFKPVKVPFITNYIYDKMLPLTMEEVRQEGIDLRYVGGFEVTMYGKVSVGEKIEVSQEVTQIGANEIIAIGTKPWVNIIKPSYVNKNYATTILVGDVPKVPQTITNLDIPLELQQTAMGAGFEIKNVPFTQGEKYTISFEYQPTQGGINDILSYGLGYQGTNIYIDDELIAEHGYLPNNKWAVGGGKHTYYMHFTKDDTGNVFSWKFNYETYTQPTKVWITNLKIHEGHVHPFRADSDLLPIKGTVWQTRTRTEAVPFQTTIVEKPNLYPSQSKIAVAGKDGSRTYTWTVEVVDGIETGSRTPEVEAHYVAPSNEIYWRGTKEGSPITEINIADYGAVYNNPNHDNKELLHQAMDELVASNGGGTITFPSKGDLYVSENIMVRENITLQGIGDKPTIKLMPSVSDFWTMLHLETKQNIKIDNLTLDSNKAGRAQANTLGDLSVLPQIIIVMSNESADIDITNNKIVGNGVWLVACHTGGIHPKNIKVNNNELFWSMGYSTPDKPFVNGVTVDNTWVYFDAIGYEFINNTLNSDTPIANMTAIEAHGANGVVRGNTVRNARTGIIPWNMVNNEMSIDNNILVEDNEFIDVLNGVDVGLSPTRNFKGLIIRRNSFHLKPSTFTGAVFSRGIILGVWNATNGEFSEDFEIYENTITSEDYQLPHADSGAYYNYYGIGIGSGVYKNLTIRDNVINGVPSFGIIVQNEAFKTINIQSGTIIGNTIKNSAKSLSNRGGYLISAIHIASRADTNTYGLTVDVNDIIDERSTTETWYTQATTMPTAPRFKEQNITETKLPIQKTVVYDSSVDGITFGTSANPASIYVHTTHIRLTAGKQYVIETDIPLNGTRKNLFVSDEINLPTKASVGVGEVIDLPLSADGYTYVSARPLKDPETQSLEPYNYSHFNDGTYKIIISEVI